MATARRRWVVIAGCLVAPLWVFLGGTDKTTTLDPTFPAGCDAILRQVGVGDIAGAGKAAQTLAVDASSSVEEQVCASGIAAALSAADSPDQPDFRQSRQCELGATLEASNASGAARAVYELLADSGNSAEMFCGSEGLGRLPVSEASPQAACAAVGRLLVMAPVGDASSAIAKALGDPDTGPDDARCLVRVRRALADMEPAAEPAWDPRRLHTLEVRMEHDYKWWAA